MQKLIGFDCTEGHRTFADQRCQRNVCPAAQVPHFRDRYEVRYPLREWQLTREDCGRVIVDAGLPLPPKSACFCCPAMQPSEIVALQEQDPQAYRLALYLEHQYRQGPHFRGDEHMTVIARHKRTGERIEWSCTARSLDAARTLFRHHFKDTGQPYQWQVSVSPAVRGLGRDFAWYTRQSLAV